MKGKEFEQEYLIRELHLDTFGHVNNAAYMQIFEEARWEIITANGLSLNEISRLKQGPVILAVEMKFLKELRLRERILIKTQVVDVTKKIGLIEQKMVNSQGETACEARFTFGQFDLENRRLMTPTAHFLKAIGWDAQGL